MKTRPFEMGFTQKSAAGQNHTPQGLGGGTASPFGVPRRGLLGSDTQLNQQSYYEASVQRPVVTEALNERLVADVVVVGGGYAGLSSALTLAEQGYSVVLLEADRVGSGASGRNGGQVLVGYASGQGPFDEQLGAAQARLAWDMSVLAVERVKQRLAQHLIDADWRSGFLWVADSEKKARQLRADVDAQARLGVNAAWAEGEGVREYINSPHYRACAYETVSGHLHPLKYALGLYRAALKAGVRVFEQSPVIELQRGEPAVARTPQGEVQARFVVLAGNCTLSAWAPKLAPELAPRIMPVGTYMVATTPMCPLQANLLMPKGAAVCDNNFVLDYFRPSADHRLLFGGRVSYTTLTPMRLREHMQKRMTQVFPTLYGVEIEHVWGGFVDISMNRAPDFGRLGDNIYYLQGFSGHGVALTTLAGELVAQALAGQAERFDLFSRLQHRRFPGGALLRTPTLALGMLWHRLRDLW